MDCRALFFEDAVRPPFAHCHCTMAWLWRNGFSERLKKGCGRYY